MTNAKTDSKNRRSSGLTRHGIISSFPILHFSFFIFTCLIALTARAQVRLSTLAGSATPGFQEGSRGSARFRWPTGLAVDGSGNIFVADSHNHAIRKVTPMGIASTFAGSPGNPGSNNGSTTNTQFNSPQGIAIDANGNLFVADTGNHTIRKISPSGTVSLFAGNPGQFGNVDGTASESEFYHPQALAIDNANNIFVADTWNHLIRKITPGGNVSTIAGLVGTRGSTDSTNNKARFYWPSGIAVDATGNLLISDFGNHLVRKITPTGTNWTTITIAGFPTVSGNADGTNSAARFFEPQGITVDSSGNIYVVDSGNQTLRLVTPSGTNWTVSTIAGLAGVNGQTDGVGSMARLNWPAGIAFASGHLYLADAGNNSIRIDQIITPQLQTVIVGTKIILSWSILDTGFLLESSGSLANNSWNPITNGITVSGDNYVITNTLNAGESFFYRLRTP